jgi:hypothetical protein
MSDTMDVPTDTAAEYFAPQEAAVAPVHPHGMYVPTWLFVALLSVTVLFLTIAGIRLFVGVARSVALGGVRHSYAAGPAFQRQAGGFRSGRGYVPNVPFNGGFRR